MIEATPTKRAVIDVGRKCNVNCKFCYYHHLGDLAKQEFKPYIDLCKDITAAHARGNDYLDFTGGEPSIFPVMPNLVRFASDLGMKSCIITNGLAGAYTTKLLLEAGVDDFLLSIHGMQETHDALVNLAGARVRQVRFIDQLASAGMSFRVNIVLNRFNQYELVDIVQWLLQWRPYIVNFINFNPHGDWAHDQIGILDVVADLRELEVQLNQALDILEENDIGANVRYFPMCRIAERHRKCVCNDLQVMFDPYEWDYNVQPKDLTAFRKYGEHVSSCMENKIYPCNSCGLQRCCGGINRAFNNATMGEMIDPIQCELTDFWHYRQDNKLTLTGGKI